MYRLVELVSEERQATRENVERKQARTANELEDDEEDNAMDEDTDDEDEQILYNPKKLPLGMPLLLISSKMLLRYRRFSKNHEA